MQIMKYKGDNNHPGHTMLNFWFAIGTIIILAAIFPLWMMYKVLWVCRRRRAPQQLISDKERYGIIFAVNDTKRRRTLSFIFVLMFKTAVLAALTLFLAPHPIAQGATLIAVTSLFVIYLVVFRPFAKKFYLVFQILNELVMLAYLAILLYLANHNDSVDNSKATRIGDALIALWLLIPTLGIVFGLVGLAMRIFGRAPKPESKYAVPAAANDAVPGDQQIEIGQLAPAAIILNSASIVSVNSAKRILEEGETSQLPETLNNFTNVDTENNLIPANAEVIYEQRVITTQTKIEKPVMAGRVEYPLPRRSMPSLSYIEKIEAIIEEVEKEQGSANPDEGTKPKKHWANNQTQESQEVVSAICSAYPQDSAVRVEEPKQSMEAIPSTEQLLDAQEDEYANPSFVGSSNSDGIRTQDRIKAMPMSLDIPIMAQSIQGYVPKTRTEEIDLAQSYQPNTNQVVRIDSIDFSRRTSRNSIFDLKSSVKPNLMESGVTNKKPRNWNYYQN